MTSFFLEKFSKVKSPASTCSLLLIPWGLPISTLFERYINRHVFHPSNPDETIPTSPPPWLSTSEACLSAQLIKKPYTDPDETSCDQALDIGENQVLKLEAGVRSFASLNHFPRGDISNARLASSDV
jgi:hypothetical protein